MHALLDHYSRKFIHLLDKMSLNFANIIILLASLQGVVLGIILLFRKNKIRQGSIFLAVVLFVFALQSLNLFLYDLGVVKEIPYLYFLPIVYLFAFGPAVYLYVRRMTGAKRITHGRIFILFVQL